MNLSHVAKPLFLGALLIVAVLLTYGSSPLLVEPDVIAQPVQTSASSTVNTGLINLTNNDEAVRAYLQEAQLHAQIYKYTNNGSYAGMCELLGKDNLFTLEQGVLRYIKAVGATGVFCSTSESRYMIEAKQPGNGKYYCIDSTGFSGAQTGSHKTGTSCSS